MKRSGSYFFFTITIIHSKCFSKLGCPANRSPCHLTDADLERGKVNQRNIPKDLERSLRSKAFENEFHSPSEREDRLFSRSPAKRWPNNEIPYTIRSVRVSLSLVDYHHLNHLNYLVALTKVVLMTRKEELSRWG